MNKLPARKVDQIHTKVDHLQFYMEHNISPVRQDIVDLSRHFERRGSLYKYLGLPKLFFKDKHVLEVGPGSGHNSLYVASCHPEFYDLLEPNPTGQAGIVELYDEFDIKHTSPNLIKKRLEDFTPERQYDVVISECWLGVSRHERDMMVKLGTFLKQDGIMIITLASPVGAVANACRRLLSDKITWGVKPVHEKTDMLVRAFGPHLSTMKDMTRPYDDWVQDCMINPGFMTICPTPEMFMEDMGKDFDIYNSYPRFNSDWRWYKSLYGKNKRLNEMYMESYYANSHNFYDYNDLHRQRDSSKNISLEEECLRLLSLMVDMEEKKDWGYCDKIINVVKKIQDNLAEISPSWAEGIEEFLALFQKEGLTVEEVSKMEKLAPVFGRELIYVTATKDKMLS